MQIFVTKYDKWLELENALLFLLNVFDHVPHVSIAVEHLLHRCFIDCEAISTLVDLAQECLGQFMFVAIEYFLTKQVECDLGQWASVAVFNEKSI